MKFSYKNGLYNVSFANFDFKSAEELETLSNSLEEAQATILHIQGELDDSMEQTRRLREELTDVQDEPQVKEKEAKEVSVVVESVRVSLVIYIYIVSLVTVLLLSILITMLFYKGGLFKRTGVKN